MLASSLNSLDSEYIGKLMNRHVVSMVAAVQDAGVIVKDHTVEEEHSILGTYVNHTLELKPVDGQPSIIRFRMPKVDEDGTFVSGASKYSCRRQRSDVPLRKISPTEVALSSYYGKTFVAVNPKVANSSMAWLTKKLFAYMIEGSDAITEISPSDVFDNEFKAPYIYSAISNHFKSFRVNRYFFSFDSETRLNIFKIYKPDATEADLLAFEKGINGVVAGYTKQKEVIYVDYQDLFHAYEEKGPGRNIYEILGIFEGDMPVDFADVRIFRKQIS